MRLRLPPAPLLALSVILRPLLLGSFTIPAFSVSLLHPFPSSTVLFFSFSSGLVAARRVLFVCSSPASRRHSVLILLGPSVFFTCPSVSPFPFRRRLSRELLLFPARSPSAMSALFNFQSMLTVVILAICTCTYLRPRFPSLIDNKQPGFKGVLGKLAVVGDRLSGYVSVACIVMAFTTLFFR